MQEKLLALKNEASVKVTQALELDEVRNLKVHYLGKKGELTALLRGMGQLPADLKPVIGSLANEVRQHLQEIIESKEHQLEQSALQSALEKETIDVTIPGYSRFAGSLHPITLVLQEIEDIFKGMGFQIAEGPEVELDYYNFEALNIPAEHPARDAQDSFYIRPDILLRTHTSSVQLRTLEKRAPEVPLRIIGPGKVYRRDVDDATHSHQFMQVEALVVDRGVSMRELKGVLSEFLELIFGAKFQTRFRPSYFPFTEPSMEVDILHPKRGWLEILGSGMVHPTILDRVGYDSEEFSGFALGMGAERIAMIKYDIEDIRHFYRNDLSFLRQFSAG